MLSRFYHTFILEIMILKGFHVNPDMRLRKLTGGVGLVEESD